VSAIDTVFEYAGYSLAGRLTELFSAAGLPLLLGLGGVAWAVWRMAERGAVAGLGVHVFVEPDPDSEGALYGVEVLRLDPRSGEILGEGERVVLRDPAEWRRAIARARQRPGPDREPSDPPR
jgi:hypothetical protein